MKFIIESFETNKFRPAEWLMQCDAIVHLIDDINKSYNNCIELSRGATGDGWTFFINVYKHVTEYALSEDECTILKVKFLGDHKVLFEDNFNDFFKLPSEAKDQDHGMNYLIPYWTAVKLSKKINAVVFKALLEMQDYPRLSGYEDSTEIIPIPGKD